MPATRVVSQWSGCSVNLSLGEVVFGIAIRMRVLLLEDHAALREMIEDHLAQRGFAVDAFGRGDEAIAAVAVASYDAIILDLGLPDVDGMEVLATIRARPGVALPAVIVTARDAIDDRVRGLNGGTPARGATSTGAGIRSRLYMRQPHLRFGLSCGCGVGNGAGSLKAGIDAA